jgi:hypothetical protein
MLDRTLSFLVAVSLALLVWLYARSRDQEVLDSVPVPVQISLTPHQAEHYSLELGGDAVVPVTFTGPPARIRELRGVLQRNELSVAVTLTVPAERQSEARYADTVTVQARDIHAPPGVAVLVPEGRNRIPVTLHRIVEKRLPVRFDHGAEEPTGPLLIEPAVVSVRGPQEVLDRARFISTQPSMLPQPTQAALGGAAVGRVSLVTTIEDKPVKATPNRVTVRMPLQARKAYELADVPINFLTPANFSLRPQFFDERAGRRTLKLLGPSQDEPPRVYLFVDLTKGRYPPGLTHEPLQIQLPRDFSLVEDKDWQRVVSFELLQGDFVIPRGIGVLPP